jgi:hypothetical protein
MNLKSSSDVWFCSFLINKNHQIHKYDVIDRGKVRCYFDVPEDKWKELKLEFNSSELAKHKQTIEMIKDLGF